MSCPIHKGESITTQGTVTVTKIYTPPVNRKVFGQATVWYRKVEMNNENDVHLTLYDFELKGQPETRTVFTNGFPKKGQTVALSYYAIGEKQVKGCIRTCEVL